LEVTPSTTNGTTTTPAIYEYTRRDVLDGLSLGVTAKITEEGKIILNIVPVTSTIEGEKILTKTINGVLEEVASAPVLSIKEAGTIIHAGDNDLVLIGGLMNTVKKNERESVPLFGVSPIWGPSFPVPASLTKNVSW
jgi:MSHA biogenesis protein MshL